MNKTQNHVLNLLNNDYKDSKFNYKQHNVVLKCLTKIS